jgi:hypothetical protein
MAAPTSTYQKLVGNRGTIGSRFSLWLGEDHVLLVEGNIMTERYQRVWFRDLQAFLVRPSRQARWVTIVGLALVVLFGGLAAVSVESAVPVFVTLLVLSLPILLYGLFLARTHYFYAVTAVQRTEWPNVARQRHIRKVLARLEPLVRAAQAASADSPPPPPVVGPEHTGNPFVSAGA